MKIEEVLWLSSERTISKGVITLKIIIKVKLFRGREGKIEEKE